MNRRICALLLVATAARAAAPDNKAEQIAKSMIDAMGGQAAWDKAHFIRYDFVALIHGSEFVHRAHLWDKRTGRYRFEDKSQNEAAAVVLFTNVEKQEGTAYISGKKLEGAAAAKALAGAYKAFINDSYWLAMPWKWFDKSVHLKYAGEKPQGGQTYDVVELTFDPGVPHAGDRYTAYVSPKSHLMEHWEYVLATGEKGAWDWQYTTAGGIRLASDHTNDAKHASINMGMVQVLDKVDDAFFTSADKWLAKLGK